jgi:hypothetical protein
MIDDRSRTMCAKCDAMAAQNFRPERLTRYVFVAPTGNHVWHVAAFYPRSRPKWQPLCGQTGRRWALVKLGALR